MEKYYKNNEGQFKLYITPNIQEKQLVNAVRKISGDMADSRYVIGICDTSLFGSGKEGILYTGDRLYIKQAFENSIEVDLKLVKGAEFEENKYFDENGKEKVRRKLIIRNSTQEDEINVDALSDEEVVLYKLTVDFLNNMVLEVSEDDVEKSDQLAKLRDMDSEVISSYLKIVTNFIYADGEISPSEYASLASLIEMQSLKPDMHKELQEYRIIYSEVKVSDEQLVEIIRDKCPEGSFENLSQSLMRDILLTLSYDEFENLFLRGDDTSRNQNSCYRELKKIQSLVGITDEIINGFVKERQKQHEIISKRYSDQEAKKVMRELQGALGAAGASVTAFGVTGMAIGAWGLGVELAPIAFATMSTGGLALAFTGVAAASVVGYKGAKKLATGELIDSNYRQAMLQEAIRKREQGQELLIRDINFLTNKILKLTDKVNESEKNTEKLREYLNKLAKTNEATKKNKEDNNRNHKEYILSKLPNRLDIPKLEVLLKQSQYRDKFEAYLNGAYHFKENINLLDEENMNYRELETTREILENIHYFELNSQNIKSAGKKLLNNILG